MALQLNLTDSDVGIAAAEAYARIVFLTYDTKTGRVQLSVDIYVDQAAREAGKNPISGGVYGGTVGVDMPSLDEALATGVRAALYTWLKAAIPLFNGAIDV